MKVLVTGFDPFGGDKVNPAYEAVKKMPDEISGAEIIKVEVPTVFEKSSQVVKEAIQQHQPDVVILSDKQVDGQQSRSNVSQLI